MLLTVVVESAVPAAQARFWASLLGWSAEGAEVRPPAGPGLRFVPERGPKTAQNRIHLDLASRDPGDQLALVERAVELGGRPVDVGQRGVPWVVLADPEGNELCVLEPRETYRDNGALAAVVVASADTEAASGFWADLLGWPRTGTPPYVGLQGPPGHPHLEFLPGPPRRTTDRLRLEVLADEDGVRTDPDGADLTVRRGR